MIMMKKGRPGRERGGGRGRWEGKGEYKKKGVQLNSESKGKGGRVKGKGERVTDDVMLCLSHQHDYQVCVCGGCEVSFHFCVGVRERWMDKGGIGIGMT